VESENPLHVVHLVHSFGTGGMEKGIATLINHSSSEFKHTIVCLTQSGDSRHLLRGGVEIIEMNKKEGNSLFLIFRLMKAFKRLKPDVVHTRNWGGLDGVIAARLSGIKAIIHGEHGWSMDDPDGMNPKRVFIRRIINRFISCYTCVSRQMKTWLETDIKVGKQVFQIYNGVDFERFFFQKNKSLKSEIGISPETIVLGIVARLDPIKNHSGLIKVFNSIYKKNSKICLLVIGDGPERSKLEKMNKGGILFLGNRSDVHTLLNCIDIFILPSFNEGISNTILEAMAAGLPVIASDRGGNPELVKHRVTGMLFQPDDWVSLENLIITYIQNPGLRKYHGFKGRQDMEKKYSVHQMVKGYESVWKTISQKK